MIPGSGKITKQQDGYCVRFERIFKHDINKVWDAITNPDKLKFWFTDVKIDFTPGGQISIVFRDKQETITHGTILKIEPPNRFEYTWEGDLAVWELLPVGKSSCKLILTYSKINDELAAKTPAGFHILLDRLQKMLEGDKTSYPFGDEAHNPILLEMHARYGQIVYFEHPELKDLRPIVIQKQLPAPLEKVWQALTDPKCMSQWYFPIKSFNPVIGFEFSFPGQSSSGKQYTHLCTVVEVIPQRKLQYSWRYQNHPGFSLLTFELSKNGQGTQLKLIHSGLETFPKDPGDLSKEAFEKGWDELINSSLTEYLLNSNKGQ